MNLLELFCHADDFCQTFEGHWIGHQLTTGRRRRAVRLCQSRDYDRADLVSSLPLPRLQGLLPPPAARSLSRLGQLFALCRVNPVHAAALMCLSASMPGDL